MQERKKFDWLGLAIRIAQVVIGFLAGTQI